MIVKIFIVGIGLNANKFINNINVYSPKQNQYTSRGNWNPNFLHKLGNNYKLHEWENHNWFDVDIIVMYYH
jgi:myo-inositol-1-phosphate synthase